MRLYAGMSDQFIRDTVHNQIAGKLEDSFFRHYRFRPSPGKSTRGRTRSALFRRCSRKPVWTTTA